MNTIFTNFKNSKTYDPHWLFFNFADTIDLRKKYKYIVLSNLLYMNIYIKKYG